MKKYFKEIIDVFAKSLKTEQIFYCLLCKTTPTPGRNQHSSQRKTWFNSRRTLAKSFHRTER
jgi:hypothetical protein